MPRTAQTPGQRLHGRAACFLSPNVQVPAERRTHKRAAQSRTARSEASAAPAGC